VHALTGTVGIVALAAGAVAVVSLLAVLALSLRLRRLRADQRLVLGDRREDLVAHSARLAQQFQALHGYVEDVATSLDARTAVVEDRLETVLTYFSLVRYDAYGEMSGRQSMSIALLDSTQSGIVLSAIHHRDQARLYAKEVRGGHGENELSPEEEEAIRLAVSRGGVGAAGAAPGHGG
jgi:hypothetical protein